MPDAGHDHFPDDRLLALVQRADAADAERAFEALYFRHRDFVFRVARRFAGDDESAMDATQEVFAYLLRKAPGLRLTGKLSTYLYPIARSCALDKRRAAARERRKLQGRPAPTEREPGDQRAGSETPPGGLVDDRAVARALESLPEGQREVLLMRVVDGLSVEEVALALDIPAGTVKSRLFHAIAAMRKLLADSDRATGLTEIRPED